MSNIPNARVNLTVVAAKLRNMGQSGLADEIDRIVDEEMVRANAKPRNVATASHVTPALQADIRQKVSEVAAFYGVSLSDIQDVLRDDN